MRTLCSLRVGFIVDFKARVYGAMESIGAVVHPDETAVCVLVSELSTNQHATGTRSSGGFRKILHGTVNNRNIVLSVSIRFKSLQTHRMHNLHIHLYAVGFQSFLNDRFIHLLVAARRYQNSDR